MSAPVPATPSRYERVRAALLAEIEAHRQEIEDGAPLNSVTLVVSLDARGLVRRLTWRTESVREHGPGERGR